MEFLGKNALILGSPWFSLSDRTVLFRQLFEGNNEDKMNAIRRVDAWKARSYPRVPLGIEVTAALVHVLVCEDSESTVKPAAGVLESMFCMALVRFVNLVTEVGKATQNAGAVSINSIASKMGVPEWIVDLRHAATHSTLPSLHILKKAALWCLDWVKINYWLAEDKVIEDVVKMPAMVGVQSVEKALQNVKSDLSTISKCDRNSKKDLARKDEAKNRIKTMMKTIMSCTNGPDLAHMLMSDGMIFPESQLSISYSSELEEDDKLSMRQFNFWWPVLQIFSKSGYLVDLIEALICEASRRPRTKEKFASIWISLLISKFGLLDKLKAKDKEGYIRLIKSLMKTCPSIAHLAICHLPKEKMETMAALASKRASLMCHRTTTVHEVHHSANGGSSAMAKDLMFTALPLGMLPEQMESETLNLELPSQVDHIFQPRINTDSTESSTHDNIRKLHVNAAKSFPKTTPRLL